MNACTFDWFFGREDFDEAQKSKEEDDIFGFVQVTTAKGNYLIDVHHEYYSAKDTGYDLEVFKQTDYGGHGEWLDSIKSVRQVTAKKNPLTRFKNRAEKALAEYISAYEAQPWA